MNIAEITLTDDQQAALKRVIEFLYSDETFKTLTGFAGTGKTTLLEFIVREAKSDDMSVAVTATTNKAVKVLRDKISSVDEFYTIHSILNIKAYKRGTKEVFKPDKYGTNDINDYDLVIIDEASMVSSEGETGNLLDIIKDKVEGNTKVLFSGDKAQLQPVNENISKVFDYDPINLDKIIRYDDGIAHVAKKLREREDVAPVSEITNGVDVQRAQFEDIKHLFKGWRSNPDYSRLLCWTNKAVKAWNKRLRAIDYGESKDRFTEGDIVIANTPCMERIGVMERIILNNSEEAIVEEVKKGEYAWILQVRRENNELVKVKVLFRDYIEEYEKKLKEYADDKEWNKFWDLKREYHDIRHCYSMTVHKSQGSTFENVVVDYNNISYNRDILNRNQLLYVAITRASKGVFILED